MADNRLFSVGAVGLLVVGAIGFVAYRSWATEEIHRVEREAAILKAQRDSIRAVANLRDSIRTVLERTSDSLDQRTDSLRERVAAIEAGRTAAERAVWHLRTTEDTERAFQETFPEFAGSLRMTEYQPDGNGLSLRYFMLPANTARTFVVYRLRSDSLELVRDGLLRLDSLNRQIVVLKDSVIRLTRLNEEAYRIGYDSAWTLHNRLREDYVRLLRQPRFRLDVPGLATVAGALAVGFAVGAVTQ